ncbi:Galactosyltransferase [Heracleum sosnowskyi]|uniref:Galactosyltransferase n=1 Tax=Heracleum sosnowskyi TaxID=360622 RepID=A0AAD8MEJ7_9APIA|nr:Galactosyltransferase [Heracleum sosnowskyi]
MSSDKKYLCSPLKIIAVSVMLIYLTSIFFLSNNQLNFPTSKFLSPFLLKLPSSLTSRYSENSPTEIKHLMFGLLGSAKAWKHRYSYIESWWRPNITRGYLYLDSNPPSKFFPWSPSSPPFKISDDISKLLKETKHVAPIMVRMVHAIHEIFRDDHEGVRWFVMGDDDSIFFVDNWVDVLGKYDHTKYFYIGGQSETILSNFYYSFNQGFGGAGFALSYPLAKALANNMDDCLRRYPYLNSADLITMSCIADLGVSHTAQKGIHQIDLNKDISGFLSSHPQAPILSLHHFDNVDPIFPSKNRSESTNHLMKAANSDQARLMQQTICYNRKNKWSVSISWGYSAHLYEMIIPRCILQTPIETFRPWVRTSQKPHYMFNTRLETKNPCEAPHIFYLDNAKKINLSNEILTSYVRDAPRGLSFCSSKDNSADGINKIQVFSPATKPIETGRSECCDITSNVQGTDMAEVKIRPCRIDEIIA